MTNKALEEMNLCVNSVPEYARIQCILPELLKSSREYLEQAVQYNSMLADIAEENDYLELAKYHREWAGIWKLTLENGRKISSNIAPSSP